jgi:hypothetical protein
MTALFAAACAFIAVAFIAVAIFAVAAIAWMERDNFFGDGRLHHDRRHASTEVRDCWCGLSRSGELNDQRRLGRMIGGRPGHIAVACRPPNDK